MVDTQLDEGKGKVAFAASSAGSGGRGTKVSAVGGLDDFLNIYSTVKQVQRLIDFKVNYIIKDDYVIRSGNDRKKRKVEEFFKKFNVMEAIRVWVKHSMIYGNGYLEWTGDQLIPRDPRKMVMYIDEEGHGEVVRFVQEIGQTQADYAEFTPEEIILLKNNPIDHLRGISELLGIDDVVNLDDWAMNDISVALNRGAAMRHHYQIGNKEHPVNPNSDKFQNFVEDINDLQPGEDLVTTHEVEVKDFPRQSIGLDYHHYLDMINARMCMQMGVPQDIFFGTASGETITQRRKLFEESEITPRRRQIENIINQEIIPRIAKATGDEIIEFRFGHVNIDEKFLEGKVDLIELQTGGKTPNEHRIEKGRNPIEGGDNEATGDEEQIPVSSRDETAEGNIGGNLTGRRQANGN